MTTTPCDLNILAPATLRLLLASLAADPHGPLDVRQKALLWSKLHDRTWAPTWATSPVPLATAEAWLASLQGAAQAWVAREVLGPTREEGSA